jgi:hypothetical protein
VRHQLVAVPLRGCDVKDALLKGVVEGDAKWEVSARLVDPCRSGSAACPVTFS